MAERKYYFLKLDGIPGESKDPDHAGWIDVDSYYVDTPRSGRLSGVGPAKADFEAIFFFASPVGRHSPLLSHATNTGWSIKSGVLEIVLGTGCTRSVSLRVRFTDLSISMYRTMESDPPRDDFSLSFAEIRYESGTPPPAAQTVRTVSRQPIWPAATQRALKR